MKNGKPFDDRSVRNRRALGENQDKTHEVNRQWQHPEQRNRRYVRGNCAGRAQHQARWNESQRDPAPPRTPGHWSASCCRIRFASRHLLLSAFAFRSAIPSQYAACRRHCNEHRISKPTSGFGCAIATRLQNQGIRQQPHQASGIAGRIQKIRIPRILPPQSANHRCITDVVAESAKNGRPTTTRSRHRTHPTGIALGRRLPSGRNM